MEYIKIISKKEYSLNDLQLTLAYFSEMSIRDPKSVKKAEKAIIRVGKVFNKGGIFYRGIGVDTSLEDLKKNWNKNPPACYIRLKANSWSSNRKHAKAFALGKGLLLKQTVPSKEIIINLEQLDKFVKKNHKDLFDKWELEGSCFEPEILVKHNYPKKLIKGKFSVIK